MEVIPKIEKYITWLYQNTIWPNFAFFSLVPLVINSYAKFEVSSYNRYRDMKGGSKFSLPIIHYTTFMGLRWRLRVIYRWESPLLRPFFSLFLVHNLAGSRDLQIGNRRWPHIWISRPRFVFLLYNVYGATMTIKGSLQVSIPIAKAFLTKFLFPSKFGKKMCCGEK